MDRAIRVWRPYFRQNSNDILNRCLSLYDNQKVLDVGTTAVLISKINMLRYICSLSAEMEDLCIRNILINYFVNSQNQCKGSEIWLPKFMLSNVKLIKTFRVSTNKAMKETLKIMNLSRSKKIVEVIPKIMGSSGRILSEISKTTHDILELKNGYSINLSLDERFASQIGTSEIYLDQAKTLVIEGSPQSVAEINKFLEDTHEKNISVIMIARSFPEEVIATLAVNWLKNKLNIIPLQYGNSISNMNSHADIISIAGGLPISQAFGDTLQVDFEERYGNITNVCVRSDNLICQGTEDPSSHLEALYEKLSSLDQNVDKIQMCVDRISGLSNDLLTIRLKEAANTFLVKEELDIAISYYNYFCYLAAEIEIGNDRFIIPYQIYDTANQISKACLVQLETIGGFLINPHGQN